MLRRDQWQAVWCSTRRSNPDSRRFPQQKLLSSWAVVSWVEGFDFPVLVHPDLFSFSEEPGLDFESDFVTLFLRTEDFHFGKYPFTTS